MRNASVALAAWTVWVVSIVLFGLPFDDVSAYYWSQPLTCIRHVSPTLSCLQGVDAVNAAWWRYHTLPILIMVAAGYVAIVAIYTLGGSRLGRLASREPPRL